MTSVASQARQPRGLVGWLFGHVMAFLNDGMNRKAVELLDVRPSEAQASRIPVVAAATVAVSCTVSFRLPRVMLPESFTATPLVAVFHCVTNLFASNEPNPVARS